jgi:hypothetical protein
MVNEINYHTSSICVVFLGEQNLIIDLDKYYPAPINCEASNFYKDVANLSLSSFI